MLEMLGGWACVGLAGGGLGLVVGGAFTGVRSLARRLWPGEAPALYQLTIVDPDGIPIRQDGISVAGVARLIRDINCGFYK